MLITQQFVQTAVDLSVPAAIGGTFIAGFWRINRGVDALRAKQALRDSLLRSEDTDIKRWQWRAKHNGLTHESALEACEHIKRVMKNAYDVTPDEKKLINACLEHDNREYVRRFVTSVLSGERPSPYPGRSRQLTL